MGGTGGAMAGGIARRGLLTGTAALAAAGCARRADPDALRFWATSYEGDYAPHLMVPFTAATGIPVDVQSVPSTAAHEKMLTAFAGGTLPDVLVLPSHWVGEFAMIGAIVPVPDPRLVDDVLPAALDLARVDGRDFAVPWSAGPQVQYFRRDLLAAIGHGVPPDQWDEWRATALALKRRRPDEFVILTLLNWPDTLFSLLFQSGATLLRDDDTRGAFRSVEAQAAFAFYKSLFDDGLAPRALSTEVQDPLGSFAAGRFAIWPSWPTLLLDLRRRAAEIPADRWGVAPLAGPRGPDVATMVASNLCVSTRSARPAEAWALVRHLSSVASELHFQRLIGSLPARASAWASPQLDTPVLRPFADQMRRPAQTPHIIEWERIVAEVQLVAERMVRGLLTIPQALARSDERVDAILAKRRSLVAAGRIA